MGLISRVSSRTYRLSKMFTRLSSQIKLIKNVRYQSAMDRTIIKDWKRIPHVNLLCIGSPSTGKTPLTKNLSGWSYEEIDKQSGSFTASDKTTKSTAHVEYEIPDESGISKYHICHIETPGDFFNKNLSQ